MKLLVCTAKLITTIVESHTKTKWEYFPLKLLYEEWE